MTKPPQDQSEGCYILPEGTGGASCVVPLILIGFRAKGTISAGIIERLNNEVKRNTNTRKSYGFRTQKAIEWA